jgi:maltooligosyltrehalose trehalohydrolase
LQNHDQLGNRAQGDRLCHLATLDRVKIGATLILTSPYIPMLFQGEEWAATSPFLYFVDFKEEPELGKAVAEGRCREFSAFGWRPDEIPDPTCEDSFRKSKLNWSEVHEEDHADMLAWHKQLIALRRRISALTNGHLDLTSARCNDEQNWLDVKRGPVRILCNFSDSEVKLPIDGDSTATLLASKASFRITADEVFLPAESVVILGPPCLVDRGTTRAETVDQGRRRPQLRSHTAVSALPTR